MNNDFFRDKNTFDLNVFLTHFDVKAQTKHTEDPEEGKHRRKKDMLLLYLLTSGIIITYLICAFAILFKGTTPLASVALNGVIGLTSAMAGYYVRGQR